MTDVPVHDGCMHAMNAPAYDGSTCLIAVCFSDADLTAHCMPSKAVGMTKTQ